MLNLLDHIDTATASAYGDDRDELTWYALPNVPTIRRDGDKAAFKYLAYRTLKPLPNGDFGAALIFMDVQLALTPPQEQTLRTQIAARINARRGPNNPNPVDPAQLTLAKPQVSDATVSVDILAGDGTLVQKANVPASPARYGNFVVAISAELTQRGVPVFEAAMKSQGLGGVRVNYGLEIAARLPPISVTGTWHASKFYSFVQDVDFDENFWSEDDFSENITEIFRNSESRTVTIDPGGLVSTDPEVAKALDSLTSSVERQLDEAAKRNLLDAIPPENRDFSKIRDEDFENIHRSVVTNKSADVTINYTKNTVVPFRPEPQGNMPSLVSQGFNWDDYAQLVDLDHPFFRQLNLTIQVNADFAELPLFSVDVSIDYPPHTAQNGIKTFTFTKADDIGHFDAFTDGQPKKFKYRYVVNYKGQSRAFTSRWDDHEGDDLKINLDALGLWLVDVEVGDINFTQVTAAELTLTHPEIAPGVPAVNRFRIDKDHTTFRVEEVLLQPVQPYSGEVKFFMTDGREFVRKLPGLTGQRLYVDDPFSVNRTVRLRTRGDFEREIDTYFVDLSYADDGNGYRQSSSIALSKDKRFFDWSFPVIDESAGQVTYRSIGTFRDGSSDDSGELSLVGGTLLLGREAATVEVTVVPDLVPWDVVKLVQVELHYVDDTHDVDEREGATFRAGAAEKQIVIPIRDRTKKSYTWTATYFMKDSSKRPASSPEPIADETLILELPAG